MKRKNTRKEGRSQRKNGWCCDLWERLPQKRTLSAVAAFVTTSVQYLSKTLNHSGMRTSKFSWLLSKWRASATAWLLSELQHRKRVREKGRREKREGRREEREREREGGRESSARQWEIEKWRKKGDNQEGRQCMREKMSMNTLKADPEHWWRQTNNRRQELKFCKAPFSLARLTSSTTKALLWPDPTEFAKYCCENTSSRHAKIIHRSNIRVMMMNACRGSARKRKTWDMVAHRTWDRERNRGRERVQERGETERKYLFNWDRQIDR